MRRFRVLAWSLVVLGFVALISVTLSDRALAQDLPPTTPGGPPLLQWSRGRGQDAVQSQPTKEPLPPEPTKPPVEAPPTKSPEEPTAAPPTKVPPTALPTKELWTNTPPSVSEPTKIPIGVLPTKTPISELPTKAPAPIDLVTPTSSGTGGNAIGQGGDRLTTPSLNDAMTSAPTGSKESLAQQLVGIVFEDDNGNGVQDANESGLPGVAVIVEVEGQQHTLVTDISGAYLVQANPQATVRVVPPAGWQVTREEVLPLDRARHFPLRSRAAEGTISVPVVTSSVINLTSVALGFVGLGVIIWLSLLQHQRARVNSFNAWARADLRLRSETERQMRRERLTIDDQWIVALLNQSALDATGESPGIDQIDRVALGPLPALVGLGQDFQRLIFTPAPESIVRQLVKQKALVGLLGESLRGVRVYPIDALNGDLFVVDDLAAAFAAKAHVPVVLPRTERWSVYVVPQQRGKVAK